MTLKFRARAINDTASSRVLARSLLPLMEVSSEQPGGAVGGAMTKQVQGGGHN